MGDILTAIPLSLPLIAAYAIFALGIVVIFRASKVLNIAHGAMAMVPAYFTYEMIHRGIPTFVALFAGIISGGLLGILVERVFVRPLRAVSPTAQTVGTVAALGLMVAIVGKVWGTGTLPPYHIFPQGNIQIGTSSLQYGYIGLFIVMVIVTLALTALLQLTDIGLAMRGAADNRRAAALLGVDPDLATTGAWVLGGVTAAIAGILLASVTLLQPLTLSLQAIPAFVGALIGGLSGLYGAVGGALIVGLLTGVVVNIPQLQGTQGLQQLVPTVLALIVMAMRGQRYVASDIRSEL